MLSPYLCVWIECADLPLHGEGGERTMPFLVDLIRSYAQELYGAPIRQCFIGKGQHICGTGQWGRTLFKHQSCN